MVWFLKGPHISVCISSKSSVLLVDPFFLELVSFPFIHSTQESKSEKSKFGKIPSLTNKVSLSLDMCPSLLCHKFAEFSLKFLLVFPIVCYVFSIDRISFGKLQCNCK